MVDRGVRRSRVLLGLCVTLLLAGGGAGCGKDGPRPGEVLDEASRAAGRPPRFPPPTRTTSTTWTAAAALTRGGDPGAQHVDRVDGRERPVLGRDHRLQLRSLRPPQDRLVPPGQEHGAPRSRQPLEVSRPGQRALLRQADRARTRSATACGSTSRTRRLPARSLRERAEVSGRPGGRARRERAGRLLLRICDRDRRPSAVSESRLRRGGAPRSGTRCATTPTRTTTTRRTWCGRTASACRARSATSARARPSRPPIPRIRSGRTSPPTSAPSTSGSTASSAGRQRPSRTTCTSCSTRRGPALSTRRSCRPTTSTTRAR